MSEPDRFTYVGGELGLFAYAQNWKRYWSAQIRPYLRGEVLEVGAGLGANTRLLRTAAQQRWLCLEPDPALLDSLRQSFTESPPVEPCQPMLGTLQSLAAGERFDAILYIDVLEHIAQDRAEMADAAGHLKPAGRVVVLSPAHQWLFSKFDASIGHFRRYTKSSLQSAAPSELQKERLMYLDACGLFLSLANRFLLRQSLPTKQQILFWDRRVVPLSRIIDRLLLYKAGKSVLGVWRKPG